MGKCKAKAIQTNLGTFRHNLGYPVIIQTYSGTFRTLCNPVIFRAVVYLDPWHIQNQKYIQNPGIFTTLVYSKLRYIHNADMSKIQAIFRTLSNIYEEVFCKNSERLCNYFCLACRVLFSWNEYHEFSLIQV